MKFLVKVKVKPATINEFGSKLQAGELDRSLIRGETYCLKDKPAIGYSIWEADTQNEFEDKFTPWRKYYSEVEINEVISLAEAMRIIMKN